MKAAIYARYSSENQDIASIDAQVRAIKEYCGRNGIRIVRTYTDEARSATTSDRPGFLQMIKDSSLELFDVVIVHKLDRFSRDRYDSAFFKRQLKKNGVRLLSVLENLDDSPESIILESVLEGMAEYYSANLAREVMKGMKETAMKCKHTGGTPALGYDVNPDGTYRINEAEAEIVRTIFRMYAQGQTYSTIINRLNEKGYKTKAGKSFGKNSIYSILTNERYKGTYVYNRIARKSAGKRNSHKYKPESEIIRVEGGIPAIVSVIEWNEVSKRMAENKKAKARGKAKVEYLLSGLVYCGECGGSMVGNSKRPSKDRGMYRYYECNTRKRKKTCNMMAVNKDYAENLVIEYLENNLFTDKNINLIANKLCDHAVKQSSSIPADIKRFKSELTGIETKINNIVDAISKGMYHSSMKEKMDYLEGKKTELENRIAEAELQMERYSIPTKEKIVEYLIRDLNLREKPPKEQKRIIQQYVQKIIIHNSADNQNKMDIFTVVDITGAGKGT